MHSHHTRARLGFPGELLRWEHRKLRGLFRDYAALRPDDPGGRERLFGEIRRLLLLHIALEEEVVYPTLRMTGLERATEGVEEARWGHRLLLYLVEEMKQQSPQERGFDSKMGILRMNLEQYAVLEERTLFELLRSMSREMREGLGARLDALRGELLDRQRHP
jgi:hypothetical protein